MNLLLVAHGTRDPAGAVVTERVAAQAAVALGASVAACFVDVRPAQPGRRARPGGAQRVASWLLAPGLFQRHLDGCDADVVAGPLADHPAVLDLVMHRYHAARTARTRTA